VAATDPCELQRFCDERSLGFAYLEFRADRMSFSFIDDSGTVLFEKQNGKFESR
jgi:hypothetical protein